MSSSGATPPPVRHDRDSSVVRRLTKGSLETFCDYLLLVANQELPGDVGQKVAPSDVVQETFLEAQRSLDAFQGRTEEELRAWLRRILINNITDATRKYRHTAKRQIDREISLDGQLDEASRIKVSAPDRTPSSYVEAAEDVDRITIALKELSDVQRKAIELRSLQGLTFVETARQMNRSTDDVRKLWAQAIDLLSGILTRE